MGNITAGLSNGQMLNAPVEVWVAALVEVLGKNVLAEIASAITRIQNSPRGMSMPAGNGKLIIGS